MDLKVSLNTQSHQQHTAQRLFHWDQDGAQAHSTGLGTPEKDTLTSLSCDWNVVLLYINGQHPPKDKYIRVQVTGLKRLTVHFRFQ